MSISSDYLSLQSSYYIDLNEVHGENDQYFDHRQVINHHTTPFSFSNLQQPHLSSSVSSLSSSSSSSSPFYLNSVTDQAGYCYTGSQVQPYPYQQEVENLSLYGGGSYDQATLEINKSANKGLKFSICKKEEKSFGVEDGGGSGSGEINESPVKWMSSKMRLMKKMMRTGEDHRTEADNRAGKVTIKSSNNGSSNNNSNNNNENGTIRVCSDCNTTKTPLWRSGPRGPKSLCNACGIRQRKARRAMAAAAIAGNSTVLPYTQPSTVIKAANNHKKASSIINNNSNTGFGAQKKRSKMNKPSRDKRKLCFEKFALSLSEKLSIQQVFPQEEKDAAILLMALSCGLVHG